MKSNTFRVLDIGALIDGSPWTLYQKLLTVLAALAVVTDGFGIQILGFSVPSLVKEWHVTRAAFAPVLALGLAGMAVGSPLAGYLGDRFGRRLALIGSVALFGLATLATVLAHSVGAIAILRFITGMGAGGAFPNASALAVEFAPAKRRVIAVNLTITCVPLGGMLGGLIAAWVLPVGGWRALYQIGGAAAIALALLMWWLLPESPRFLAQRPDGRAGLVRFLTRAGHTVGADCVFEDRSEPMTGKRDSIRTLFSPLYLRDSFGIWIAFFSCLAGIYLIFGWLPAFLSSQGLGMSDASRGLASYNFGGVLGVLVWSALITTMGSRGPLFFGCLAGAGSAFVIMLVPMQSAGEWPLLLALGLNGLLANAVQTSLYALAAHIYPTSVRSLGISCASALGRGGAILSSYLGAAIISAGMSAYCAVLAVAMLFTFAGLALVRNQILAPAASGTQSESALDLPKNRAAIAENKR